MARAGREIRPGRGLPPSRGRQQGKTGRFRPIQPAVYNLPMHDIPHRIADVLMDVEATLRSSGRWEVLRPPEGALLSPEPFCIDTLSFEQWLQWIFLPRMKRILEFNQPLPAKSGIFVYAQQQLRKEDPPAGKLLTLIKRFDDLISIQSAAKPH